MQSSLNSLLKNRSYYKLAYQQTFHFSKVGVPKEVRIIGTEFCPYCVRARDIFDSYDIDYQWIDSDETPIVREKWRKKLNYNTVPMIFINNTFIGGFTELSRGIKSGDIILKDQSQQSEN